METLEELRVKLDEIDDQIVNLYEQRMDICAHVGEYKIQTGKKVLDRQREKEKLESVAGKASNPFNKKGVTELYEQLMSMSRKLQYEQLVKAGALGRLPFIQVDSLDVDQARVVFPGTEGAERRNLSSGQQREKAGNAADHERLFSTAKGACAENICGRSLQSLYVSMEPSCFER